MACKPFGERVPVPDGATPSGKRPPRRRSAEPEPLAALCHELEQGLGPFGFLWLCACAVYPGLRFPLSVYLGRRLAEAVGRQPPDEDEHLALFRLPWFRTGWMPEELRLALLQRLDPAKRPVVREAIEELLFNALDDAKRDPAAAPPLDFAPPPTGWRAKLSGWLRTPPPGALARDAIFVHYMLGRVPSPADLRLNRRLARLFGARLAGWLGRRTLASGAAALAATAAVWLFSDDIIKPLFMHTETRVLTAPEMVALPGGTFVMGSPESEAGRDSDEGPQHAVTIKPFAIGKHEVTFDEWDACVAAGGCNAYRPDDAGWGRGRRPVINVSWNGAQGYVDWLAKATGKPYRLPTEAEWEYAARAGTTTPFALPPPEGSIDIAGKGLANCDGCGSAWDNKSTAPVGSFPANAWGLHDLHGNVREWIEDVWHASYQDAPVDGSAWTGGEGIISSRFRVLRGGSWDDGPGGLRSANRFGILPEYRGSSLGFRVARTLD